MVEPLQNCFRFYHPDGISSAHEYSEREELLREELLAGSENKTSNTDPASVIAQHITQHDLALSPPFTLKKDN